MKIAIITGASSGIGKEFAIEIAKKYKTINEIWIIARREERLVQLSTMITNKKVRILPYDLTNEKDIDK